MRASPLPDVPVSTETPVQGLEDLLEYLKQTRGFDFTGYKRASLERRVAKRMSGLGIERFDDYLDYLEVHPEEFEDLFNTVLINVTTFFRDTTTWDYLAASVIPELLARRGPGMPIRVWCAGCATGQEAYTLAMVFAEHMGVDTFRDLVKIYATDVDDEALSTARHAVYTAREVADVPPALLKKYFDEANGAFTFHKDLRRQVIFGRHDLIQDAPISRVDLLTCRNTIMYFNAETQARILARFQFALNDQGILVLGRAETMMTHAGAFSPVDLKRRISIKLPSADGGSRDRLLPLSHQGDGTSPDSATLELQREYGELRDLALESVPVAQILVDIRGTLTFANERARTLFSLPASEIGRPLHDLKISYRPVELRSALDRAYVERRPVALMDIEWPVLNGDSKWIDVHVCPLLGRIGATVGASITFTDVTTAKRLQRGLEHANQELETAYEELQSTNEELETTNEELQSTVEELETTNEELQSTNEELETMNEELQSTNEELQSMNDELRQRGQELNQVNGFLESILTSMRGGVIVVDAELQILGWNQGAEELWGLRESEVSGKNLLGLDIGIPTERLKQPVRACLTGNTENTVLHLESVNRRGRTFTCQVTVTPLLTRSRLIHGAILRMEPADGAVPDGVLSLARNG